MEVVVSNRIKGEKLMQVTLSEKQLKRLIRGLKGSPSEPRDEVLVEYLERVIENSKPLTVVNLDEIPF